VEFITRLTLDLTNIVTELNEKDAIFVAMKITYFLGSIFKQLAINYCVYQAKQVQNKYKPSLKTFKLGRKEIFHYFYGFSFLFSSLKFLLLLTSYSKSRTFLEYSLKRTKICFKKSIEPQFLFFFQ
jgi:hypothetical protein